MLFSTIKNRLITWARHPVFVFSVLALTAVLAYGLLIPWLHLYIDDWIWVWTWEKMGRAGLVRYFSTNRPIWGLIFQITLPMLGKNVLAYHLFSLAIRFGSAISSWWLVRLLWPKRPEIAFISALFFLAYPGFILQPIALTYGHLFLIYIFFLLSLCFNILALRIPRWYLPCTALAILLSAVNLLSMEYFFTLELIRPVLIWFLTTNPSSLPLENTRTSASRARVVGQMARFSLHWLPYLLLMAGIVIWRTFIYKVIIARYHLTLLDQLHENFIATLYGLVKAIGLSLWNVTFGAWLPMLNRLAHMNLRQANSLLTLALVCSAAILIYVALSLHSTNQNKPGWKSSAKIVALGAVCLILAGWPFWLTGLKILPLTDKSRFTIPFILGASLLFTGLLDFISSHRIRYVLIGILLGLACGYHFQIANIYRIEWEQNRQLMWQIASRIPNMQEGTTLLITDFPVTTYDTATLMTELNMIYPITKRFPDLAYNILYDREQDQILPGGLIKDTAFAENNVTSWFHGSTSQVLSAQYNLSKCFRLLDPEIDAQDPSMAAFTRKAARLSSWQWLITDLPPSVPPSQWFGKEPNNQWCYFFEKAELARQMGDWTTAAHLGDVAEGKGLTARDELEKLVFVEAYAHTEQWGRAIEISQGLKTLEAKQVLCLIRNRIAAQVPDGTEKEAGLQKISQSAGCPPIHQTP